jgi:hypothetical protein
MHVARQREDSVILGAQGEPPPRARRAARRVCVELDAYLCDVGVVEARELLAGLVDGEPRVAVFVSQMTVCSGAYIIARGSWRNIRSAMMWLPMR